MVLRPKLKMEKPRGSPRKQLKTSYLCIPRLKNNSCNNNNKTKRLTPMTLLERFREAVFRLIMFSAFSKASDHAGSTDVRRYYHSDNDHRHTEAVADCIEFIKKKALPDDQNRDSSASSSADSTAQGDIQVPVTM